MKTLNFIFSLIMRITVPFQEMSVSHVRLFVTPWTIAHQASLSMDFSRQEYRVEFPFPTPRDLPDLGIKTKSPALGGGFLTV